MSSMVTPTRRLIRALTIGGLLTFAVWVPALAVEHTEAEPEGCPGTTTLVAQFEHGTGGWTTTDSDSGITVTGDSSTAHWTASSAVTGVIISAGGVTQNFVYDPPETTGQISSSDVEDAGGGALLAIGFCQGGGVPNPSSGSPISIDLTKSANCAAVNADGTYTVSGTITVSRHSPPDNPPQVAMRITAARDVVLAPVDVPLQRTTVATLEGALLPQGTASITQPYSVTFNAMGATALTNKVEIMVEEAASGLDRHKYYSARVAFGLCAIVTPTPTQPQPTPTQPQPPAATSTPAGAVLGSTPTPRGGPLPNTAAETGSAAGSTGLVLMTVAVLVVSLRVLAGTNLARSRQRRGRR